jgi:DNA-binding SARP family transcriptional activator/tetratricopeptide (TPR) repeat protein
MIGVGGMEAPPLRIELLGRVRAWRSGDELALGPPVRQSVLAVLALRSNQTLSRDEIIDAVWDHEPPASVVNALHVHVGALRQVLEPARGRRGAARILVTSGSGYLLRLVHGQLDVDVFCGHLESAQRSAARGELARAVAQFDAAFAVWCGTPLAGLRGRFAEAERRRLVELRVSAIEDRVEAMLGLGQHAGVAGELSKLIAEHPLRERPRALLMTALYRDGRRADALKVFTDARRVLVDELGIEPGPQLRQLHHDILTDQVPAVRPGAVGGSGPPGTVVPRQLPPPVRHFAGRSAELAALTRLVEESAGSGGTVVISAVDGMAGVGKTALAVCWGHRSADRFPDGQLYVNLRGFDPTGPAVSAAQAVRGFLDALGVPAGSIPASLEAQVGLYRSVLAGRRMLVLLDNAFDVEQVRALLPGAPGSVVLVTSRNRLTGLVIAEGAHPLSLDVLTTGEARELLASRLGEHRTAAETGAVDEIIGRCAHLPLALAVVAARAASRPGFALEGFAAELRQAGGGLDVFADSDSSSNVRAVFSWSYHTLKPEAARLFRLLGLHCGPDIDACAAASLAAVPVAQARLLLTELARAHLIIEHAPDRFTAHDLLRAYATELAHTIDADDERRAAQHRVLDYYLHTGRTASLLLDPLREALIPPSLARPGVTPVTLADRAQAMAWFTAERPVLLAAVAAAANDFDRHSWQLAWTLRPFLQLRGDRHDWVATYHIALGAAQRLDDSPARSHLHRGLGSAFSELGRHDDAQTQLGQALEVSEEIGDHLGQAHTHGQLAKALYLQGDPQVALVHAQRALELFRSAANLGGQALALNDVGWLHAELGDYGATLTYCQQALDLFQQLGNRLSASYTWDSLGYAHHHLGHHPQATSCYHRALHLYRELGNRYFEAEVLTHLGDTHHSAGDPGAAHDAWQQALTILDNLDHPDGADIRTKLRHLNQPATPTLTI